MASKLEKIVLDCALGKIELSKALMEAESLLKGKILDSDYQWIVSELSGYPIAEGDTEFEGGLPPAIPESRLVYCSGLGLKRKGEHTVQEVNGWPSIKGMPENRLQVILWPISEVEAKLKGADDYLFPPALNLAVPGTSPDIEGVMYIHRSQLERLLENVRNRFLRLAGSRAQGESK
ncbi:MAG: hypothetical protein JSS83_23270 [Cyanobacteria bacterium SZAS LIN-3]|nr:hypothetical protein [Cyanobacteria bacterium SZAS LIN-3]